MDIEVKSNGVVEGLDILIDAGNVALAQLWAVNGNSDAIEALELVNKTLAQTREVLHVALKMLHDKDAALEQITNERDDIANAYHDQTATIDDLRQKVDDYEAALAQWTAYYQEQS